MSEQQARHNFYGPIHKALRFGLSQTLLALGQTDYADDAATARTLEGLRAQLAISASHLRHEEDFIHGPLEARMNGAARELEAAHRHHDEDFLALEALAAKVQAAQGPERAALGRELYLLFSSFMAEDFAHMAEEELVTMPLLHSLFSDAELMEMEGRILASVGPEEGMAVMRLMLPAMSPPERIGFLSMARDTAPPEMFQAVIEFAAKPSLPPQDWADLSSGLGLAA